MLSVLQLCTIGEPLFPNMKTLDVWAAGGWISFIPLFLSQRTTVISIGFDSNPPKAMVASMITTFPKLCPNLQEISLYSLPRDPMVTAAVSGMVLATNRNTLQCFRAGSPLTEEACEVVYKLPDLRLLSVVVDEDSSLPSVALPNLTSLIITYDHGNDWLQVFRGATFEKLQAVTFISNSEQIEGFLEAFERAALAASAQNALSQFSLYTSHSWNPNYSSLLRFTQLFRLDIDSSCDDGCSSTVDDDIVTNLARAMPKLQILRLGDTPCREIPIGVTAKGLVALADHCPDLHHLCIHIQVASLSSPPAMPRVTPDAGPAALRRDCALKDLEVGEIPIPEESVLTVALTLASIFPRIELINCVDGDWEKVLGAIHVSRRIINYTSEQQPLSIPRNNVTDTSPGAVVEGGS